MRRTPPMAALLVALALVAAGCGPDSPSDAGMVMAAAPAPTTTAPTAPRTPPRPTTSSTTTTTTPPATTTPQPPPPQRERLVIHAVGDVRFGDDLVPVFRRLGHDAAFAQVDGIFTRDDLTILNLECVPSDLGRALSDKPFSFRCGLEALPAMSRAGIDVAGMANNHSADYGFEALADGRANLETAGLNPVGAGADLAEANAARFFEVGGWTIAVVAFSAVSGLAYTNTKTPDLINPWFATPDAPGIAPATSANMAAVVSRLDTMADIVIVSIHQGAFNETREPLAVEVERIEVLVAAGADVVVAHHHHRLLPFEYLEGVPIFWGMGNFVWERLDPERDTTAVAEIVVARDGTITGRLIPARITSSGRPVLLGSPDPAVRRDRQGLE